MVSTAPRRGVTAVQERACRACRSDRLDVVLDLGSMPLANRLLDESELGEPEPRLPLALIACAECSLVQTTVTVDPEALFTEYPYFSSVSASMVAHYGALAEALIVERNLGPDALVVELASNDGYLLQHYVSAGIPVLGVDPAENVAAVARQRGVPTVARFFDRALARELRASGVAADVIHANNVLAHVPDINAFVAGMADVLKSDGVIVVETPYVRELVERLEFDTVYHEHVFYYSLTALVQLFRRHGLTVTSVERLDVHGGSLRVRVERHGAQVAEAVPAMLDDEQKLGVNSSRLFDGFADHVAAVGRDLTATLAATRASGKRICAYGAAAKGATLLNAFGIGRDLIDFVADLNPHKHGRYLPGVRLAIKPASALLEERPDVCLILAWNHAREIVSQQEAYRQSGGTFIVPVGTLET